MKKHILFLIAMIFSCIFVQGQYGPLVFTDTITFETSHSPNLRIDTSQSGSIWKIGAPSKTYFNSSYTLPNAIFTDTGFYPADNYSYFDLIIDDNEQYPWYEWGEGILGFWHKYDTDTLKDGGFICVSYDGGNIWQNIIEDSIALLTTPTNFYTQYDTITGNIPAFSGHSDGWVYSQVYWFWNMMTKNFPLDSLMVRFVFKSDSDNNNKEGWLVDQIFFNGYMVVGGLNNGLNEYFVKIYPNPVKDVLYIDFQNPQHDCYTLELFDNIGNLVLEKKNIRVKKISLDNLNITNGIYFYKLICSEQIYTGKLYID